MQLEDFIQVYDVDLPDDFLETMKNHTKYFTFHPRTHDDVRKGVVYDVANIPETQIIQEPLYKMTEYAIAQYSKLVDNPQNNVCPLRSLTNRNGFLFHMYKAGGYCGLHVDLQTEMTFILALNDDYEGGAIQFYCGDKKFKELYLKKHQLLVFPSNMLYAHAVTEVTKGERFVIVAWIESVIH
jgi:hypothetical protein